MKKSNLVKILEIVREIFPNVSIRNGALEINWRCKMKLSNLFDKYDEQAVIKLLKENQYNFDVVPVKPTREMRKAFHESLEKHEQGEESFGSPDDQWLAMLNEHKAI